MMMMMMMMMMLMLMHVLSGLTSGVLDGDYQISAFVFPKIPIPRLCKDKKFRKQL
jgi:hypothetical protein